MATLTLRNIPDSLYKDLKETAELNRRSINSEILVCIEKSIRGQKRLSIEETIARASKLRKHVKTHNISPENIIKAKNSGRP